jgi:alkanesulfonate monooxygenase SsuD/methylene tetrahydromethanopterin reductase-like flavin-dependent oxidoreductase (luciferase family)
MLVLQDDPQAAEAARGKLPADRSLVGSPVELVDRLGGYAELGIDEVIVPDFTLGRTPEARPESVDRLWSEVAVAFR